jgi:hypothetical protein
MTVLGYTLYFLGIGVTVLALIWSFIVVYRDNMFLAILCLFLPMGLPVVMLLWFPRTWEPLAAWGGGLAVFFCGIAVMKSG